MRSLIVTIYRDVLHQSLLLLLNAKSAFAGHCFRAKNQVIPDVFYWRLPCPNRGVDLQSKIEDLPNMMMDKHFWLDRVNGISIATAK